MLYDILMSPLELLLLSRIRRDIIAQAAGSVLEIGIGSGANFKYYDYSKISSFIGLDTCQAKKPKIAYPIKQIIGSIEKLPFEAKSFDSVVETLVLCTVDIEKSIAEIRRVLKPGGLFIFMEHVEPQGHFTASLASRLNPLWKKLANGCNLNRQTDAILQNCGFSDIQIHKKGVFRYGIGRNT